MDDSSTAERRCLAVPLSSSCLQEERAHPAHLVAGDGGYRRQTTMMMMEAMAGGEATWTGECRACSTTRDGSHQHLKPAFRFQFEAFAGQAAGTARRKRENESKRTGYAQSQECRWRMNSCSVGVVMLLCSSSEGENGWHSRTSHDDSQSRSLAIFIR